MRDSLMMIKDKDLVFTFMQAVVNIKDYGKMAKEKGQMEYSIRKMMNMKQDSIIMIIFMVKQYIIIMMEELRIENTKME